MLENIFISVLNMSLVSSFVILFVIIARYLLKKAPKIYSYSLWSFVLFRLVCPDSFLSALSIIPINSKPISHDIIYSQAPSINTGITALDNSVSAVLPAATPYASMNPMQGLAYIGIFVWLIGIAALIIYSIVSLVMLKSQLKGTHYKENIYFCDGIKTPFVIGVFKPKIYLPSQIKESELEYVVLHEKTHIKRLDHVIKIVAFLVLCVHWFNPLVWLAFFLFGKDMEMSCDESVIKKLGYEIKKEYSNSLLSFATGKRVISATPLAFGEGDTKGRIKNLLSYKKPGFWVTAVLVLAVIILGVSLLGNRMSEERQTAEVGWKSGEAPTTLEGAIHKAVLEQNGYENFDVAYESHIVLANSAGMPADDVSKVVFETADAVALFKGYKLKEGRIDPSSLFEGFLPVKISFNIGNKGEYILRSYRAPRDGVNYDADVVEIFSQELSESFLDISKHYDSLNQQILAQMAADGYIDEVPAEPTSSTVAQISNTELAKGETILKNGSKAEVKLVMTQGEKASGEDIGFGGGIAEENYIGDCEIQVYSNGNIITRSRINRDEKFIFNKVPFEINFSDVNGDKNPDFSIGQWGSSSIGLYTVYSIDEMRRVWQISDTDAVASSEYTADNIYSVAFKSEAGKIATAIYDNASGEMRAVLYELNFSDVSDLGEKERLEQMRAEMEEKTSKAEKELDEISKNMREKSESLMISGENVLE